MKSNSMLRAVAVALCVLPAAAFPLASQAPTVTLEEAIHLSLQRDPAAVAAEAAVDMAAAGRMQARGSLLPTISAQSFYTNSSNQRFDQATGQLVSQSYNAQLTGGYDVFTGGRRLAELRVAGAELAAAEASSRAQQFTTMLQTTRVFYDAAASGEVLSAATQRLQRARQQLDFAETRLELGTATTSDVLRAELEVANAELAVLEAETSLRNSQLELGRRIGYEGEVSPEAEALPAQAPPLPPTGEMVSRALRVAPGVVSAEASLRSRRAARLATFSAFVPSVRMTGGYDWTSFDWPPESRSWNLRVTASIPVFNGLVREATIQRAAASERVAQARARDAQHQVRVAVEAAAREIETAERRVAISERSVGLAQEDLRVQEERYQIGAANILELQASQVALADAEVAAVRARQALGMAVAQLEAVLGERIGGNE
jgi:outer membrane protein